MNENQFLASSENDDFNILNSTKIGTISCSLGSLDLSPVKSNKSNLELLKEKALLNLPEPAILKDKYKFQDVRFNITQNYFDERDFSSIRHLKERFIHFSQVQKLRYHKKMPKSSLISDENDKSNIKILALKKVLEAKMKEKRKLDYEKRVMMYKINNEDCDEENYLSDKQEDENEFQNGEEIDENHVDKDFEINNCNNNDNDNDIRIDDQNNHLNNFNQNCLIMDKSENDESFNDTIDQTKSNLSPITQHIILSPLNQNENANFNEENQDALMKLLEKNDTQLNNEQLLKLCSGKVCNNDSEDEYEDRFSDDKMFENDSHENSNSSLDENSKKSYSSFKKNKVLDDSSNEEDDEFAKKISLKFKNQNFSQNDNNEDIEYNEDIEDKNISENENENKSVFDILKNKNNKNNEKNYVNKHKLNVKEFIDDQAELSEEEAENVSSDEDDNENDEYEHEEITEDLPSDDEIIRQNNEIFWKQQKDEDKRKLLEIQERFLENSDLENQERRQRKFKWRFADNDVWIDKGKVSENDSDEFDFDDEDLDYSSMHLKPLTELPDEDSKKEEENSNSVETNSQSQKSNNQSQKSNSNQNNETMEKKMLQTKLKNFSSLNKPFKLFSKNYLDGPSNDIQSYIINDKNLVNAISIKRGSKPNKNRKNPISIEPNKKLKIDSKKETKKSIFDAFNI